MGVRTLARSGTWILSVIGACLGAACSTASDGDTTNERQGRTGSLELPLRSTGASGAQYYLHGSFIVADESGAPVAELAADADRDAQLLMLELSPGAYTVELVEGWTLERVLGGETTVVEATLVSPSIMPVRIAADQVTVVMFKLATAEEPVDFVRRTLGIGFEVDERAACGNGIVDPRETCDAGSSAGEPGGCDSSCAFRCVGACPLRVDPGAAEEGDGTSWESPATDIQAAIDTQAARGGGDIWVRGPGPYAALTGEPDRSLMELRDGVRVYGGFIGNEIRLEQRDPSFSTTIAGADVGTEDSTAPLIVGASDTVLDGFTVSHHDGAVLSYRGAEDFRVSRFTIDSSSHRRMPQTDVQDSSGVFEAFTVRDSSSPDSVTGINAVRSQLRLTDVRFERNFSLEHAGMIAVDSSLALERVWFVDNRAGGPGASTGLWLDNSDAFAWESFWLGNTSEAGTMTVRRSRFVGVGAHFEDNGNDASSVTIYGGGSALFLNSSFVANRATMNGTVFVPDGELEVVNTSFFDNRVEWPFPGDQSQDIGAQGDSELTVYNSYSNRGEYSVVAPYTGSGNCFLDETQAPYIQTDYGYTQVFLREDFGCTDIGDDAAVADATLRARAFAVEVGSELVPTGPWWSFRTSVYPICSDTGPIDPGRHYGERYCP